MVDLAEQHRFSVGRAPHHEGEAGLPLAPPRRAPVRLIAYYLPQFHPIPENDAWWGRGFTEWTNVTKALPAYVGHQQPRLPADLGFYDLGRPDAIRRQAALARRAGLSGFCIHDYWFSGRKVLETPLRLILDNPDIDVGFCLNWANESWSRRWDGSESSVLIEQRHEPGDALGYAASILPALRDPRYIRVDGRPLVMVYRPAAMPDPAGLAATWRRFFVAEGVGDPYLVMPLAFGEADPGRHGFDAAAGFPPHGGGWDLRDERDRLALLDRDFRGRAVSYGRLAARMLENRGRRLLPGVCPGWDNEARKPRRGFGFFGASPAAYGRWLEAAARGTDDGRPAAERIVFVNAWNEWAEGAYLEPDRHSGFAYLNETRRALDRLAAGAALRLPSAADPPPRRPAARPAIYRVPLNKARRLAARTLAAAAAWRRPGGPPRPVPFREAAREPGLPS